MLNRRVLKLTLFDDAGDYIAFLRVLHEAMQRQDAPQLFAFCLMPNHWHLLVQPTQDGSLPRWMQWLTVTHTHRWHMHHETAGTGPVYQGRFKSFPVQNDKHFLTVARYIERNPVRAGLCQQARQWRWSSLALRMQQRPAAQEACLKQQLSSWPVDALPDWPERVDQPETGPELDALRRSVARGTPFGSDRWMQAAAARLDLASTLRPRGRPAKEKVSG